MLVRTLVAVITFPLMFLGLLALNLWLMADEEASPVVITRR